MAYENKKGVALMGGSFLLFISLPYPLCHDCSANLVGMARMSYPPTICNDNSELLLMYLL